LYGRAKVYIGLKQHSQALDDIERVILLKPDWRKVSQIHFQTTLNYLISLRVIIVEVKYSLK
jgi:hypothetical protein